MKRLIASIALAVSVSGAQAQNDVLKPFRPPGAPAEKPPAEKPADPADGEIPRGVPTKPKPPVPPPTDEEKIPRGVPIRKPSPPATPTAPPVPVIPATPAPPPATPQTTPRAATPRAAMPEFDADIVIRPDAAPTSPDQVQLQYADGFFARKNYRDAAPEYERYLELFPKTPPGDRQSAYYRLAECYRNTGAMNNAKANYEAVLSGFADGQFVGYAAYRLGTILYEEKDFRGALPVYRRASVRLRQPTLVVASKFFIARCLEATGQRSEARTFYEELAGITVGNPYQDASRLSVGRLLSDNKRSEEALTWLEPLAASTNPQIMAEAVARCGLLFLDTGKLDQAEKYLTTALTIKEAEQWRDDLGTALYQLLYDKKDYTGVIAKFQADGEGKSFKLETKLRILVIIADAYRQLGKTAEAVQIYETIMRDFPGTPQSRDAAYSRVKHFYETEDQRLLDELNAFLNTYPTAPQVENVSLMKAEVLFNKGDFTFAAPIYQVLSDKGKKLQPALLGECVFRLGICRSRISEFDKADEVFSRFLKEFPAHPKTATALAERGEARKQLKQFAGAQRDFEELTQKHPKAKEREFGLENLALIYGNTGNQQKMAETFEILLRDFPNTPAAPKAHHWIGRQAMDAKNFKKAIEGFDKARQLDAKTYFDRDTMAIIVCAYNLDDWARLQVETSAYKAGGGKLEIPTDITRGLAVQLSKTGKENDAEPLLADIILKKEATPEDFLQIARIRVKLGKHKDAVDSFDSFLKLTNNPIVRAGGLLEKCDAQIAGGDHDGAFKTSQEGLAMAPEGKANGEFRLRSGQIEFSKGNFLGATKVFEGLLAVLPDDEDVSPRAIEHAIECRKKLHADDEVKRLENLLRSRFPEYLQKKAKTK